MSRATSYTKDCTYHQDYRKSSDTYVAPYTTIVGLSGIGKSFVVRQLSVSHRQYVIYINLSEGTAGGYPKRSTVADIIDTFPKGDVGACTPPWKNVIVAAYWDTIICYDAGIYPEYHFKLQVRNDGYRDQLRVDIRRYLESLEEGESGERRDQGLHHEEEKEDQRNPIIAEWDVNGEQIWSKNCGLPG